MVLKNKRILLCTGLMLFSLLIVTGSVFGEQASERESLTGGGYLLANADTFKYTIDQSSLFARDQTLEDSIYLAQADTSEKDEEKPMSAECAAFARDPDADLGEVLAAGCQPTLAQMSALMDNPLGNVAMLFTQFDMYKMTNEAVTDDTETKSVYTGIAQFPKGLGENWNLINRVVWQVPSMPLDQDKIDAAAGGSEAYGELQGATLPPASGALPIDVFSGRTTGFGDLYYVGLFAPKEGKKFEGGGSFLWGAGFDLGFPTASDDILGTGKWTAGPSGLAVYMGPKWKIGGLLQQYWSYAGDDDRDDVNLMNLQYFVYYSLDDVTSIGAGPNILANWEQDSEDRWTVPIGLGINRTFQIGKVPVRFGVELHYSVIQPDNVPGSEWDLRFYVIPAVPSAMFSWMK